MTKISRGRATAIIAALGALVLLTTLPTWVAGFTPTATGDVLVSAAGTKASPATASIGLIIVAAGLLLGLAGRVARVGALVAVMAGGVVAIITIIAFLRAPDVVALTAAAEVTSVRAINLPVTLTVWPYLSIIVLLLAVFIAVWSLTHLGTWANVGRRYERAAPKSEEVAPAASDNPELHARRQAMDDWDAITRGEDPT